MSRIYFVDRDLGYKVFPGALEDAGLTVVRHDDVFEDAATPDAVWLPHVANKGWIAVSGDQAILRRPLEVAALRESSAIMLVVVGTHVPALELARNFVNTLPKIESLLTKMEPPAVAKIYRPTPRELVSQGKPGRVRQIPLPQG